MGAYKVGTEVKTAKYNTDPYETCGEGLHITTLKGAKHFMYSFHLNKIVKVAVYPQDVICVPHRSLLADKAAKIRVKRLFVVGEIKNARNAIE